MISFPTLISLTPDFCQVFGVGRCFKTVETVFIPLALPVTPLKWGVNERRLA